MSSPKRASHVIPAAALTLIGASSVFGGEVFSDDFDSGAALAWGNEIGEWVAESGVYFATLPNNNPPTASTLPFTLRNFTIDVDINDIQDGGVWLRAELDETTGTTLNGVILVTGGFFSTYTGFYWHVIENGTYSGPLAFSGDGLFESGVSDVTIHVRVRGDMYQVFLDDVPEPVSTLTTSLFCEGRVGLYDFSNQTFDNVVVTELPATPDVDGDGEVAFGDLLQVLASWGPCGACCLADVNEDGHVNFGDLLDVLSSWGAVDG